MNALVELRPVPFRAHAYLAASYGHLGQIDEARTELSQLIDGLNDRLRKLGEQTSQSISHLVTEWADRYREPTDRENFLEGLRKAGLPE